MQSNGPTNMIRLECDRCDMTALGVENNAMWRAWREHMATHDSLADFSAWTWKVMEIDFHEPFRAL